MPLAARAYQSRNNHFTNIIYGDVTLSSNWAANASAVVLFTNSGGASNKKNMSHKIYPTLYKIERKPHSCKYNDDPTELKRMCVMIVGNRLPLSRT